MLTRVPGLVKGGSRWPRNDASSSSLIGAAVAVFALLGTDSVVGAANKVTSNQIKNGTIQTEDMKKGAITSGKVKDQSLTGTDIKDGSSIGAADLSAEAKDSLATTSG